MEDIFYTLNTIQKVNFEKKLFDNIQNRIQRQNTVSTNWVATVAAALVLFFSSEMYVVKNLKKQNNNMSKPSLISQNNKLWYYEKN